MVTITVPEEIKNATQRADIECSARRDIITHIMEKDIPVSKARFEEYQKDYDDKFFAFEQAKSKIEKEYVRPVVENPVSWSLDYHTNTITVVTSED